jgi:hypothetical protein
MKILSTTSSFFQALPSHYQHIYPAIELADINDDTVTHGKKTIMVGQGLLPENVVSIFVEKKLQHILQCNSDFFLQDLETVALILDKPEMYFAGQTSVLLRDPMRSLSVEFSAPDEKADLKKQTTQFLSEIGSQNVMESADALIEELYMNAALDAPNEARDKYRGEHAYLKGEKAKLTLVQSPDRLCISCADPYGSLNLNKFTSRLHQVYQQGAGQAMNMKRGAGAGIGCMIMFENCDSLFLGVIPEKLTVVSCIIPLGLNYRQRAKRNKSLHLITI